MVDFLYGVTSPTVDSEGRRGVGVFKSWTSPNMSKNAANFKNGTTGCDQKFGVFGFRKPRLFNHLSYKECSIKTV